MHFTSLLLKEKKLFYVVAALFIIFLYLRISSNIFYLSDSYEYLDMARLIYKGTLFSDSIPHELKTKRPVVYPLFLMGFITFPVVVTLVAQTLIGVFTLFIVFKILENFDIKLKKKHVLLFIFTPSIYIYTQLVMAEWLVLFFVTALFWLLTQKWSSKNFALIQFITLLLAFTKPVFYPLVYLNLVFFIIYFIKKRVFSYWIFLPIIVMQSYMVFIKSNTGYYHFSSMQNINLIDYNLFYFKAKSTSENEAKAWINKVYASEDYQDKSFSEKNSYLERVAKNEIKSHFFSYAFYHFYTSIRGIFDPGRFDLMTFFKKEDGRSGFLHILNTGNSIFDILKNKFAYIYILLIPIFLTNLVKWFYGFKYIVSHKLDLKLYYIILVFASYVLLSGPVNCSRYLMPFQGVLIIFAILGFNNKTLKHKRS